MPGNFCTPRLPIPGEPPEGGFFNEGATQA